MLEPYQAQISSHLRNFFNREMALPAADQD